MVAVAELVIVYNHACSRCALGIREPVRLRARNVGRDERLDRFCNRIGTAERAGQSRLLERVFLLGRFPLHELRHSIAHRPCGDILPIVVGRKNGVRVKEFAVVVSKYVLAVL